MTTKRRGMAFFAVLTAGALALSACGGDDDDSGSGSGDTESPAGGSSGTPITVASDAEFTSYNGNSETGNGTWNTFVLNGVLDGFWDFGPQGEIVRNEAFGTYEVTSEDPLTVRYTFAENAVWSDGEPIDCDDLLLEWATQSGQYMTDQVGEDGQPIPLFAVPGTTGYDLVAKPTCQPGDKEVEYVYSEPFADWEVVTNSSMLPAHVAAEQAGMTAEDLVTAIQNDDMAALTPVAEFWNTGWDMGPGALLDQAVIPASGPYTIDSWEAGQSLTLVANENYYGDPPATDTIVIRFIQQDQQVQALANGEVDIIAPQVSVDLVQALEGLGDQVTMITGDEMTWEHLDFNQTEGAVFADPNLRQAFAMCVPRQQIVENLIQPANPEAVVMNLREIFPWDPTYDQVVGEAYDGRFDEPDIEGAKALIDAAGAAGTQIRVLRSDPNPRRADTVAAIKASCDQAGFEIVDTPTPDLGAGIVDVTSYEVALFAWAGSGVMSSGASLYRTNEGQNPYGYSNPDVDAAWTELIVTVDEDRQTELLTEIETHLWNDLFSIPLYAHPGVTAHNPAIEGVQQNAAQTQVSFNMEEWSRTS
ncbi:ABC transporter family substrate-binding protein [Jiangella sp. DSM 45060]|uniref:ABC transporter family substrate-binding protein n=1 Tax=Jiangella sp. DSM 45060 TaxID=1798224 RepID=UPI000879780B|nr:ABC transporter family substrate-binding protein [Jiangella sp. DSM 45060]SDT54703.1 peptide/nickel transport system substrate-binding protein [Jiangella sp. DSM 45060]